jgi:hypothetical protein
MGFTNQLIDRGIIPLIGISLLFLGYIVDPRSDASSTEQKSLVQDIRFWVLLLSSLLGLIYFVLVPLHIIHVVQKSDEASKQFEQQATQTLAQVDSQTKQVEALVKNPQALPELDKAIGSGRIQGEQLAQAQALKQRLEVFKKDPKALTQEVETAKSRVEKRKQELQNQANSDALKLGLRTGLSGLFLAIGYIAISWTGLRGLGSSSASRSKF